MAKTYGIISELHSSDIQLVPAAIEVLKNQEIDALVLNGDLFGERSGYNEQDYLATVLDIAGKSNLETYVLPGSHEEVHIFEPVLAHYTRKYSNIINTFSIPHVPHGDHDLVFLQGSDWRAGGATAHGYSLEDKHETGFYENNGGHLRVVNMHDLSKLVRNPDKTLLFSHVPRKFQNVETSVDMAEFGVATDSIHQWQVTYTDGKTGTLFTHKLFAQELQAHLRKQNVAELNGGTVMPDGTVFPLETAKYFLAANPQLPIALKKENRGNEALGKILDSVGVTKQITGHFHESAGRANDLQGRAVEEGMFVPTLFYNASCLDRMMVGMVSVDGPIAAYENLDLRKYLK